MSRRQVRQTQIIEVLTTYTADVPVDHPVSLTDDLCRCVELRGVHFGEILAACETMGERPGFSFDGIDLKKV